MTERQISDGEMTMIQAANKRTLRFSDRSLHSPQRVAAGLPLTRRLPWGSSATRGASFGSCRLNLRISFSENSSDHPGVARGSVERERSGSMKSYLEGFRVTKGRQIYTVHALVQRLKSRLHTENRSTK